MKIYAWNLKKFEKDSMMAFLIVKGQYTGDIILDLECHDYYEAMEKNYNILKLLLLIKKVC